MSQVTHTDVVIANAATVQTGFIDLSSYLVSGFYIPAEFEGTAITFQACQTSDGTYLAVYDAAGTQVSVTCAASRHVLIEPQTFAGAKYLKLVAGTSQTGAVTIKTVLFMES